MNVQKILKALNNVTKELKRTISNKQSSHLHCPGLSISNRKLIHSHRSLRNFKNKVISGKRLTSEQKLYPA